MRTPRVPRDALQAVAMLSMALDHAAVSFLGDGTPAYAALRLAGRVAYPVFMVLFMDGCARSRSDSNKRFGGLLLACLAAEPFFDYMLSGTFVYMRQQNVLLSWALSLAFLHGVQDVSRETVLGDLSFVTAYSFGFTAACWWLAVDYGLSHALATIGCWACGLFYEGKRAVRSMAWWTCLCVGVLNVEPFCLLAVPLLYLYDPDAPGARFLPKGACRWFYPVHLAAYAAVRIFLVHG